MIELLLATGNPGKVAELNRILAALPGEIRAALPDGGMRAVVEDAETYEGNARRKAEALSALHPSSWVVADDSGLEVDALGGEPGTRSARFGEPEHPDLDDAGRRRLLLDRLTGVDPADRGARFVCVLALARGGRTEAVFRGECRGEILAEGERGSGGFGYDPIFLFPGAGKTFGEMGPAEKDRHSHRAQAVWRLAAHLLAI